MTALGPMPHPYAIEALRRSLFTVVPSILPEPFGLAALETAAAGKPIVAADIGGLRDIVVDGETGLLVPPGDRRGAGGGDCGGCSPTRACASGWAGGRRARARGLQPRRRRAALRGGLRGGASGPARAR